MMNNLISVIIPVYNVEKYVKQCIESVMNQSYQNLEIIIIDDGSTDNSGMICDGLAANDDRIIVIHQLNKGLSAARNAGLEIAKGNFIAFVDSDDIVEINMYELMLKEAMSKESDLVICRFDRVDGYGNIQNIDSPIENEIIFGVDIYNKFNTDSYWHYIIVWNKLYRKDIFSKLRFPLNKINEDQFIAYDVFCLASKIVTITNTFYHYRDVSTSIMHQTNSVKTLDGIEASYMTFKLCERDNKTLLPIIYRIAIYQINAFSNITINNRQERERKKEIKRMIRYMYFHTKGTKNIKSLFRAIFPEYYVSLHNKRKEKM